MRDRAIRRFNRAKKIRRKVAILRKIGGKENVDAWTGGHPGRLSKNKIHCSCCLCRRKSFDAPSMMDTRGNIRMTDDLKTYKNGEGEI